MTNELLEFESGVRGLALNLDVREVGVVILGDFAGIEEGQQVRRTGELLSVPVGDGYLGRVVDPLGNPIDGGGPIESTGRRALRSEEHTSELQSRQYIVCRLLLEKKNFTAAADYVPHS